MNVEMTLLRDREHYETLVRDVIANAKVSVWIATANVKGLMIEAPRAGRRRRRDNYESILDLFERLSDRGVEIRLLHSGIPSGPFRSELKRRPDLLKGGLKVRRCPRVHLKIVAVDGSKLYIGSANFTGAGLGAKGEGRRNFEAGILTSDEALLDEMQAAFDRIWTGAECPSCKLHQACPRPLEEPAGAKGIGVRHVAVRSNSR